MRKFLITVLGFAILPMLFACKGNDGNEGEPNDDRFKLLAIVKNVGEKLEVEVIESAPDCVMAVQEACYVYFRCINRVKTPFSALNS